RGSAGGCPSAGAVAERCPSTREGFSLFPGRRFRKVAVAAGAAVALGAGLVAADPQVDGTDLYAFRSPDRPGTVTFISNWIPFEEPAGGPNFYAWADGVHYDINIYNYGDAKPDVIY